MVGWKEYDPAAYLLGIVESFDAYYLVVLPGEIEAKGELIVASGEGLGAMNDEAPRALWD